MFPGLGLAETVPMFGPEAGAKASDRSGHAIMHACMGPFPGMPGPAGSQQMKPPHSQPSQETLLTLCKRIVTWLVFNFGSSNSLLPS